MTLNYSKTPVIQQGWLRAIIFCAAYILANFLIGMLAGSTIAIDMVRRRNATIDMKTLVIMAIIVSAIVGIVLSLIFRRFIDSKPIVTLGLDPHLNRNDAWAGLLLSIVLIGLGSLKGREIF